MSKPLNFPTDERDARAQASAYSSYGIAVFPFAVAAVALPLAYESWAWWVRVPLVVLGSLMFMLVGALFGNAGAFNAYAEQRSIQEFEWLRQAIGDITQKREGEDL